MILPMLAEDFDPSARFPKSDVQPKIRGIRCVAWRDPSSRELLLGSRNLLAFDIPQITRALEWLPVGFVLDGEVYVHGEPEAATMGRIRQAAKPLRRDGDPLCLFVFDVPASPRYRGPEPWAKRKRELERVFKELHVPADVTQQGHRIQMVPTFAAAGRDDALALERAFVDNGFEGAIVRAQDAIYEPGARSTALLKIKTFQDAEFKVIGADAAKPDTYITFKCITPGGKVFDTVIRGNARERQSYYRSRNKFIGKFLTVRFWDYTDGGKPYQPVGLHFRMKEDLPRGLPE